MFMFSCDKQRMRRFLRRGFSLLELAVVLVIISFIAGGLLTIGTNKTKSAKWTDTRTRMTQIEDALGAFLLANRRLPCPADPSIAPDAAGFGVEDCTAATTASATTTPSTMLVGSVPTFTLAMSDETMLDGWGRRYTYVVYKDFTLTDYDSVGGTYFNTPSFTMITPTDEMPAVTAISVMDNNATPNLKTDLAIMVLISHGENGHGAWLKEGGAARNNPGSLGAGEDENAEDPTDPLAVDEVFTQDDISGDFDDIVDYKTKEQMILTAGGILDSNLCGAGGMAARVLEAYNVSVIPSEGPVGCDASVADNQQACSIRQVQLAQIVRGLCFTP